MRPLAPVELLDVWDRASALPPYRRASALLEAACPELGGAGVACLALGERDRRLIALRAAAFGTRADAVTSCPACGTALDLVFALEPLLADAPPGAGTRDPRELEVDGCRVVFRDPTGEDLEALDGLDPLDDGLAEAQLVARCVVEARRDGTPVSADSLPAAVTALVADRLADASLAAPLIETRCSACGHAWTDAFDVPGFLWAEIGAWAERLLHDVHVIASAYGWTERDIAALPPRRRQRYVELIAERAR
jgi:hypothetical protein